MGEQPQSIHRRRHAVVIELGGAEAVQSLVATVFDRVLITDAEGAEAALAGHPDVSVILVDGSAGVDASVVLVGVKDAEPAVPIVLFSNDANARADITLPPDADAATLTAALDTLTEVQSYDDTLVEAFSDAVIGSIEDGFLRGPSVTGAFYKTNRRHLADVNALLHFEGGAFSGWVCIAADQSALKASYGEMFDGMECSDQEAEDLAGEMANHIVARLRRWLPDSRPRVVSVPEIMRGRDGLMRKTRVRHTLTLELTTNTGPLFAQLHFSAEAPIEIAEAPVVREAFQMF